MDSTENNSVYFYDSIRSIYIRDYIAEEKCVAFEVSGQNEFYVNLFEDGHVTVEGMNG